ncbi:DNA-formamidopyrimidine glycosylase family protein [Aestuariimicrobium sp. Y1814]|uniref:DNA-formamidopyrimidine glycosylase family protein n=1 Tax=Aestuariimicrobium sp. Y1814 TaxID=3418742 RepID=UPI003DA7A4C4
MPEGDAVWRAALLLDEALRDQVVTRWELRWGDLGASDKRGCTVTEVVARGKHLLLRLDDATTLHTHLRMEGRWRVVPVAEATARRLRDPWLRAVVGTGHQVALGRQLGNLDLVATAQEGRLVGHLGPDLLGEDWDAAEAVRRISAQPEVPLGEALLEQRNLAGIGTMWAAEICFLEQLNPWRPVADLVPGQLEEVVRRAHRLLRGTLKFRGSVSTGNWRDPLHIYGKPGRACPRCATAIRRATIGRAPQQRELYYCPRCQPMP